MLRQLGELAQQTVAAYAAAVHGEMSIEHQPLGLRVTVTSRPFSSQCKRRHADAEVQHPKVQFPTSVTAALLWSHYTAAGAVAPRRDAPGAAGEGPGHDLVHKCTWGMGWKSDEGVAE